MNVWNDRFLSGHHPWDIGRPSPLLTRVLDELFRPPARVMVVGFGRGWEVEALLQRGFEVTGLDIAPAALDLVARRIGKSSRVSLQVGDILDVSESLHGSYDMVVEHTCLCSIPPSRWVDYVASVASLLVPGGNFVAAFLCFDHRESDGPPFGAESDTIRDLFCSQFEIHRLADAPECFPPADVPVPPEVYRVAQLEAVFEKRPLS